MPDPPRPKAPGTGIPLPPPRPRLPHHHFESPTPSLPSALPKRPELTKIGAAGPPAPNSAPSPLDVAPVSTTLESNDPQAVPPESPPRGHREPRILTPPQNESPATQARAKRAIERGGDRVEAAPESLPERPSDPSPASRRDERWWRSARGMAIVLPIMVTSATGFLGGLTATVVVPIIKAVREPTEGAKVKDIAEAKAAGERCDAAVASERKARLAREEDATEEHRKLGTRVDEIARRVPEVKADPSRPPAKP